ncbi:non-ribosomal peptide synthetase [Microbispora sp. H10670]|uniref:non-ribosomal peptide synthetase n=1 Tax=Microbispora sp. H10670 TaxID=2729108 RepID=UPI0016017BAB|nr:non-ribosomal peptide synthetase [Microbispora sp. H10670]
MNDAAVAAPRLAHVLVERQAALRPHAEAIRAPDGILTFRQLDGLAAELAVHLRARLGVGPEDRVGVCLDRGIEVPFTILGIWKAGAAYVPVDPGDSPERRGRILADADVSAVVTTAAHSAGLPAGLPRVTIEGTRIPAVDVVPGERLDTGLLPRDLAYVIYTSGSTGTPKGVMVEHASVVNLALSHTVPLGLTPSDRVLGSGGPWFDGSVFELFVPLAAGACVVIPPTAALLDPPGLIALIRRQKVTFVSMPPSVLGALPVTPLPTVRAILVAAEPTSAELAETWAQGRELYNSYGPTEAAVAATLARYEAGEGAPPIGRAVEGVRVDLLDDELRDVGEGVTGEIVIAGAGIARGYAGDARRTAERFLPDPRSARPGGRMYRTGDLGRRRADGVLEFTGRADHQVKIRGHRVEPGEVEAVLRRLPGIGECVVTVADRGPHDRCLVAYYTGMDELPVEALRDHLGKSLPEYMIPSFFVRLDRLPLTANNKVDRRALPAPPIREEPPAVRLGAVERVVQAAFAEILGAPVHELTADIFTLGGHSLQAVRIVSLLCQRLEIDFSVSDFFTNPSPLGVSKRILEGPEIGRIESLARKWAGA